MRDYALLAKSFRHCAEKRECASCPMYVKERKCPDFEVRKLSADAIEELLAENKAIKQSNKDAAMRNKLLCDEISRMKEKVPHWISVEERLPKTRSSILGRKSNKVIVAFRFDDGTQGTDTAHTLNGDWVFEDRIVVVNRTVTHWMPLPEPPKEDAE